MKVYVLVDGCIPVAVLPTLEKAQEKAKELPLMDWYIEEVDYYE